MNTINPNPLSGFKDLVGFDAKKIEFIRTKFFEVANLYNTKPVILPCLERTNLFQKSAGETSEIVEHQMFSFIDKDKQEVCLSPEGTAQIARIVLKEKIKSRLSYFSKFFRRERPQKGRQREFHQAAIEFIGEGSITSVLELIGSSIMILNSLNIESKVVFHFNFIGDQGDYILRFQEFLRQNKDLLSSDSQNKIENNPLRVWDSKDDQEVLKNAPKISDFFSEETLENIKIIESFLTSKNLNYCVDHRLVRGLDYYTGFVFEFVYNNMSILGGGQYDNLIKTMGGSDTQCMGWAMGIERTLMLVEKDLRETDPVLYICPAEYKNQQFSLEFCETIRATGIRCQILLGNTIKSRLEKCLKNNDLSGFFVVIGDEEIQTKKIKIKNLTTQESMVINLENGVEFFCKSVCDWIKKNI